MGWSNVAAAVLEVTTIIIEGGAGTGSGIFVYYPEPGNGNLVATLTPTSGTDPYGNNYSGPGLFVYGIGAVGVVGFGGSVGSSIEMATDSTTGSTTLDFASGLTTESSSSSIFASPSFGGGGQDTLVIAGPFVSTGGSGAQNTSLTLGGQDSTNPANFSLLFSDGSSPMYFGTDIGGFVVANTHAPAPGSLLTAETWHTATLDTNWGEGGTALQYRLLPDGDVELRGMVVWTGSGNGPPSGTAVCTLPTAYQPSTTRAFPALVQTQVTPATAEVNTSGVLTVYPGNSITTSSSYKTWSFDSVRYSRS